MSEMIVGGFVGAGIARLGALDLVRRRRAMSRHPRPTFLFADLVGYTTLTEQCGDAAAARVAGSFLEAIRVISREYGAWCVKSMGDGAMIWAPDASGAIALAAAIVNRIGTRPGLLPVRVGADTGSAALHDGDWYGHVVNVAARLMQEAEPNEALVTDTTHTAAGAGAHPTLRILGELDLRGLAQPAVVWRLVADVRTPDAARMPTVALSSRHQSAAARVYLNH